jgi:hypothetical protein
MRILAEKCDPIIVSSTLGSFHGCSFKRKTKASEIPGKQKARTTGPEPIVVNPAPATSDDEVWNRIAVLKQRPTKSVQPSKQFEYDPNQPLQLPREK